MAGKPLVPWKGWSWEAGSDSLPKSSIHVSTLIGRRTKILKIQAAKPVLNRFAGGDGK